MTDDYGFLWTVRLGAWFTVAVGAVRVLLAIAVGNDGGGAAPWDGVWLVLCGVPAAALAKSYLRELHGERGTR